MRKDGRLSSQGQHNTLITSHLSSVSSSHPSCPKQTANIWRSFFIPLVFSCPSVSHFSVCFPLPMSFTLFPSSSILYLLLIDHLRATLCSSYPTSLGLNTVSMKTNVTPRIHDTVTIFQPKSICHRVTRTDPLSNAERDGKREAGKRERGAVYLKKTKNNIFCNHLLSVIRLIHQPLTGKLNPSYFNNLDVVFVVLQRLILHSASLPPIWCAVNSVIFGSVLFAAACSVSSTLQAPPLTQTKQTIYSRSECVWHRRTISCWVLCVENSNFGLEFM